MLKIDKMTVAERVATMEQLWDSLSRETPAPQSPSWHRQVLAERKQQLASGKAKTLSVAELRKRLSR